MLCANFIYSDPVTYVPKLTQLSKYFKCCFYHETLSIQIDLVVVEIHSLNYAAEIQNRD